MVRKVPSKLGNKAEKLFDVTCLVGTIYHDPDSDKTAYQRAFELIGSNGGEGVFEFPNEHGDRILITVETHPVDHSLDDAERMGIN